MNKLITILVILAIIYLLIMIVEKAAPVILGIMIAALLIWIIPLVWKVLIFVCEKISYWISRPVYWFTGYEIIIPWFILPIAFIMFCIPMLKGRVRGDFNI